MPRQYEVRGQVPPMRRGEVQKDIESFHKKGFDQIEGEEEKTPDQVALIRSANEAVVQVLQRFRIEGGEVRPEQVHLLKCNLFRSTALDAGLFFRDVGGYADLDRDAVYVPLNDPELHEQAIQEVDIEAGERQDNAADTADEMALSELGLSSIPDESAAQYDRWNEVVQRIYDVLHDDIERWVVDQYHQLERFERNELVRRIIHEVIHLQAFRRYYLDRNHVETEELNLRTGYDFFRNGAFFFRSLNEAVTESLTQDAIEAMQTSIAAGTADDLTTDVSTEEFANNVESLSILDTLKHAVREGAYVEDRKLLGHIVERIAEAQNEEIDVIWQRFKRCYLTGNMMHLRDIERIFGKGTLRFYAGLMPGDLGDGISRRLVWKYFGAKSDKARRFLAEKLEERREVIEALENVTDFS